MDTGTETGHRHAEILDIVIEAGQRNGDCGHQGLDLVMENGLSIEDYTQLGEWTRKWRPDTDTPKYWTL